MGSCIPFKRLHMKVISTLYCYYLGSSGIIMLLPGITLIFVYKGFYLVRSNTNLINWYEFFIHACHLIPSHCDIHFHLFWMLGFLSMIFIMLFCVVFYVCLVSKIALKILWEETFPDDSNNDKNNNNGRNNNDDTVNMY